MLGFALATFLIMVFPALQLWKSLRKLSPPKPSRQSRYVRVISRVAIRLLVLAIDGWWSARPIAALGMDFPVSPRGRLGLAVAAVLIVGLSVAAWLQMRRLVGEKLAGYQMKLAANDLFPHTANELVVFVIVALVIGTGWELLYRGFLLWVLSPFVGVVCAVCIAAVAYGVAHGCRSRGQFVGSIVSAFAFTIAYAMTHSLWWLMLLHAFMGVFGGVMSYRLRSMKDADPAGSFAEHAVEPR